MELTKKNKQIIDDKSYEQLLREWRNSPSGDPWFNGETGKYWGNRMNEIEPENHVAISKKIGWGE